MKPADLPRFVMYTHIIVSKMRFDIGKDSFDDDNNNDKDDEIIYYIKLDDDDDYDDDRSMMIVMVVMMMMMMMTRITTHSVSVNRYKSWCFIGRTTFDPCDPR